MYHVEWPTQMHSQISHSCHIQFFSFHSYPNLDLPHLTSFLSSTLFLNCTNLICHVHHHPPPILTHLHSIQHPHDNLAPPHTHRNTHIRFTILIIYTHRNTHIRSTILMTILLCTHSAFHTHTRTHTHIHTLI
ncbi:hypothetical protein EGW08_017234 [Elysia chlorotica]|uniref:Uncharacterized protein n=1 Tax=Elysia chlorotica TaxID=188477 RepID=A0A433T0D4_ELYCH|nr:hypothetical protein EGW08_017234 [Elysia chlorotica]